jgi:hypothetical protein
LRKPSSISFAESGMGTLEVEVEVEIVMEQFKEK